MSASIGKSGRKVRRINHKSIIDFKSNIPRTRTKTNNTESTGFIFARKKQRRYESKRIYDTHFPPRINLQITSYTLVFRGKIQWE
jgi:hypothetical protein